MVYSILIASLVPLVFLYIVRWLDFFETNRPGSMLLALGWGVVAFAMSYLVDHPLVPIFGRPTVAIRIGPAVEEIFKSLMLVYLVRRADYTYFVDGAIYGFAVGIGFAVAENMLYLSRVDVDTGIIVAITRAFSSSVMHGGSTALVGIVIGGFPLARMLHPLVALVVGWALAIAYHMTYNDIAFKSWGQKGLLAICGVAFAGLAVVSGIILWGLRHERRRIRRTLVAKAGISKGEAGLIRHMDDLDRWLDPVETRFGAAKRQQVASLLLLGAQLAMKEAQIRGMKDRELQAELAAEITAAKAALRQQRRDVGLYVMSYVRSIVPRTQWSLWARLSQTLAGARPASGSMWSTLATRPAPAAEDGRTIHARIAAELAARQGRSRA
ncbi:MAG TPA: PrsW family glutamic-type intramembrane protease [Casimicrobiaceae bacterium]|jgi:RsiW-degrading membrane proteinase PrsW (M82 family)